MTNFDINEVAKLNWSNINETDNLNEEIIGNVYQKFILKFHFSHRQIQNLEITQYLEKYLWPNFDVNKIKNIKEYVLSICAIINEKIFENVNAWETIENKPLNFSDFFKLVLEMLLIPIDTKVDLKNTPSKVLEEIVLVQFLNNCLKHMTEFTLIFDEIKHILSMGMWACLTETKLELELNKSSEYRKRYNKIIRSEKKSQNDEKMKWVIIKRRFLPNLVEKFLTMLNYFDNQEMSDEISLRYLENCLVLFINLESMLVSRRHFTAILDDKHVILTAQRSSFAKDDDKTKLFCQLLEILDLYVNFEIDELSGSTLTELEIENRQFSRLKELKTLAFKNFNDPLKKLWLSHTDFLQQNNNLTVLLNKLSAEELRELALSVNIISDSNKNVYSNEDLLKLFTYKYKKRYSTLKRLNNLPLYPTEDLIYDENRIPDGFVSMEDNYALPQLSVQYLSFHDYLMRNFELFRLEAAYEIKQDIESCLTAMKPYINEQGEQIFGGWSRMGFPIDNFEIIEIGKPEIDVSHPKVVRADVTIVLNTSDIIKSEWESLNKFDPCFLITVCPDKQIGHKYSNKETYASQTNLLCIRGCEIEGLLDKDKQLIPEEERRNKASKIPGQSRTWRVKLDPCQYYQDVMIESSDKKNLYNSFNIFMRRKPKENNFKAVLETIRDLMNDKFVVPSWLQDLLLGFDNPNAAHYSQMTSRYIRNQNWVDTFLNYNHVTNSFPQYQLEMKSDDSNNNPPYKLYFPSPETDSSLKPIQILKSIDIKPLATLPVQQVESYKTPFKLARKFIDPNRWSLFNHLSTSPENTVGNTIPFTPTQVEAIRSGMQEGLTLVVGPPGTGKTDVAVQIINNIYQNYPNQRTLIVTHSNQALNQLFEKIMHLGIDERHLLRLGHGEEELETTKDFSKYGRVNYVLAKRLELLGEVQKLAICLKIINKDENKKDLIYTCENSQYFLLSDVMPRWTDFLSKYQSVNEYNEELNYSTFVKDFPFTDFFIPSEFRSDNDNVIHQLFSSDSLASNMEIAEACFKHLLNIFIQLDDFRSFEILRNGLSRANALLTHHAKIIAMTCTHAALRRRDLIQLGFTYDNILIEEAAQILEIETFIPLLLQKPDMSKLNRLKRWIMIGDHNQLPPVIKNMVFQNYCNMSQSMFSRLVKMGVPHVQLDAQGRSRPSLRKLYSWRYKVLDDLPSVINKFEYLAANPGFLYDYQLINVPDYLNQGESEPTPHYIQNIAEAEYSVAIYMYMLALGYPADKITILTTYNGQKHLIKDVLRTRLGEEVISPSKVTTVDRFQGQQNDYIILSLVRTKNIGHLRDMRRLVVAMSRARLGLYILCRVNLFAQCRELQRTFSMLTERSTELMLVGKENYGNLDSGINYLEDFPQNTFRMLPTPPTEYNFRKSVSDLKDIYTMKGVKHMCDYVNSIFTKNSLDLKRNRDELSEMNNQNNNSIINSDEKTEEIDEIPNKKLKSS